MNREPFSDDEQRMVNRALEHLDFVQTRLGSTIGRFNESGFAEEARNLEAAAKEVEQVRSELEPHRTWPVGRAEYRDMELNDEELVEFAASSFEGFATWNEADRPIVRAVWDTTRLWEETNQAMLYCNGAGFEPQGYRLLEALNIIGDAGGNIGATWKPHQPGQDMAERAQPRLDPDVKTAFAELGKELGITPQEPGQEQKPEQDIKPKRGFRMGM